MKSGLNNKEILFSYSSWSSTSVLHLCDSVALQCHQGLTFFPYSALSPSAGWQLPLVVAKEALLACWYHIPSQPHPKPEKNLFLFCISFLRTRKPFLTSDPENFPLFLIGQNDIHFLIGKRDGITTMDLFIPNPGSWWGGGGGLGGTSSLEDGHSIPVLIMVLLTRKRRALAIG